MRFTHGKVIHLYYFTALIAITAMFAYGIKYYWEIGLLNIDYVSTLYDGTSKVKAVKERNDLEEIKKFIDGDRIKEANKLFTRLETDIKELKAIKGIDEKSLFDEKMRVVKQSLVAFQSSPELSSIINSLNSKVSVFEEFVVEKQWPTISKMTTNLRLKLSPSRLMTGGMYNFERTQNLVLSVNNDLEAITNFTESSGLQPDIKSAIVNRMKSMKSEALALGTYVDSHTKFNREYKEFSDGFNSWFRQVEPEIAFKKIQFEKSSQTIFYSLIIAFSVLAAFIVLGVVINSYSSRYSINKTEKLVIDTIKDGLLPVESKKIENFSPSFMVEFDKYRDYAHKRMAFGSIFQEAMPFASILLDSNLNMVWGNSHFYEQWQLQNFKEDDESLSWDFLQRFTDLEDNSAILSALRMSAPGVYKLQVKSNTMAEAIPYEMFVSPVDYANQKRIMVIFYPMSESEKLVQSQKIAITNPLLKTIELHLDEAMNTENYNELRIVSDKVGVGDLFSKINQYVEKNERTRDELNSEIEILLSKTNEHRALTNDMRKSLVSSFETQKASIEKYTQFKSSVSLILDSRELLEEQFKFALNSSREMMKDQTKIFTAAEKAEKNVDEYIKSLKTITVLKGDFKELKNNVDDFKSKIIQTLDQLLIFQSHENDTQRIEQFLGKIKIEMKGFEKVLQSFNEVVTQLDVTVTKVDMMVESRERIDLDSVRYRIENIKNNLENIQFSASKISQSAHSKDEEMINSLKSLVINLKTEMKRINEMCKLTGMNQEHLEVITSNNQSA
ncbi:MAG: hypothetical protein HOP07_14725 [Bacteriovoracaceae bacterium]|nr:hypothetical protein [Bacteriovoracaceae bacterium]